MIGAWALSDHKPNGKEPFPQVSLHKRSGNSQEVAFGEASNSHHIRRKPPQDYLPEARFSGAIVF
jgi:hypothetical protein